MFFAFMNTDGEHCKRVGSQENFSRVARPHSEYSSSKRSPGCALWK